MSFYGQILYEFTKLFTKINISNNSDDTVSSTTPGSQPSLVAADRWDQVNVKGGNHWIHLTSNATSKDLTITHAGPGAVDNSRTVISFKPLTEEEVAALSDTTVITPLVAAQCFQTTKSEYDKAGHSVSAQTEYFSLPISATEQDLSVIKEKHLTVPESDTTEYAVDSTNMGISIADYLSQNEYLQQDYLETAVQNYLDTNNYVTTNLTGVQETIYPTVLEQDRPTIVGSIGIMDNGPGGLSRAMNAYQDEPDSLKLYSISDVCALTLEDLKDLKLKYNTLVANYALQVELIQELRERVGALENPTATEPDTE